MKSTDEFKGEAVRLVRDSARSVAQVARDLGIADHLLYRWLVEQRQAETQGHTRGSLRTEQEELVRLRRENMALKQERDFFKTCGGVLRKGVEMRYRVIQEHDRRYPIRLMCRALADSAAGYYAWRSRPESARSIQTHLLRSAIRVIHQMSRETYGSPRIWETLVKPGHRIGEHHVARLMCVKPWRATTQSQHRFPVAANTLDRAFTVEVPNRVWARELIYAWTLES